MTKQEWSDAVGIPVWTIDYRIRAGWSVEDAVSTPLIKPVVKGDRKKCNRCKTMKLIKDDFSIRTRRGRAKEILSWCRECERERGRKKTQDVRIRAIEFYSLGSKRCALCPEARILVLDLDHVRGGGTVEKKALGTNGVYLKALREKDRSKYRVLCRNCNWITWQERLLRRRHEREEERKRRQRDW